MPTCVSVFVKAFLYSRVCFSAEMIFTSLFCACVHQCSWPYIYLIQMPVPVRRTLPTPPVAPTAVSNLLVPMYLRPYMSFWPYNCAVFYNQNLERQLIVTRRCLCSARHAHSLLLHDRLKLKRYRDFKEWVCRFNRMSRIQAIHKKVLDALQKHMYDDTQHLNGHA